MENKKYVVVRLDGNCTDYQYEKLSELLNGGYFICNEYKLTDFVVIILKLSQNEELAE